MDPKAHRELLASDVGLIYNVAEPADIGPAAARERLGRLGAAIAKDPLLDRADVYLLENPTRRVTPTAPPLERS